MKIYNNCPWLLTYTYCWNGRHCYFIYDILINSSRDAVAARRQILKKFQNFKSAATGSLLDIHIRVYQKKKNILFFLENLSIV